MNMPGFTAENSLSRRSGRYCLSSVTSFSASAAIQPAFSLTAPEPRRCFWRCHIDPVDHSKSCERVCSSGTGLLREY